MKAKRVFEFLKSGDVKSSLGIGKHSEPLYLIGDQLRKYFMEYLLQMKRYHSGMRPIKYDGYNKILKESEETDFPIFINNSEKFIYFTISNKFLDRIFPSKSYPFSLVGLFSGFHDYLNTYDLYKKMLSEARHYYGKESYIGTYTGLNSEAIKNEEFPSSFPSDWIFFGLTIFDD